MVLKNISVFFTLFWIAIAHATVNSNTPSTPQATQKKLSILNTTINNLKKKIQLQKQKEVEAQKQLEQTTKKLKQTAQTLAELKNNIANKRTRITHLNNHIQSIGSQYHHATYTLEKALVLQFQAHQQKNTVFHICTQHFHPKPHLYSYYVKAQKGYIQQLTAQLKHYKVTQQTIEQEKVALDSLESEVRYQSHQLKKEQSLSLYTVLPQIKQEYSKQIIQLNSKIDEHKQLEKLLKKLTEQTRCFIPDSKLNVDQPFARAIGKLPFPIHQKNARLIKNAQSKFIIPAGDGSPVHAVYPGRVIFAEFLRGLGLLMIIDHGQGYMSLYGNNQVLYKQTGDWVNIHDTIGIVGNTTGKPNNGLYFEIRKNGRVLNARQWLQNSQSRYAKI